MMAADWATKQQIDARTEMRKGRARSRSSGISGAGTVEFAPDQQDEAEGGEGQQGQARQRA